MKIEKKTKSTRRTETTLRTERYGIESTGKRGVLLVQGEENMKSKKNGKGNWYILCVEQSILISLTTMYTSIKIIKNEVGCRDDTVPKTVDTRRHCEEE